MGDTFHSYKKTQKADQVKQTVEQLIAQGSKV